MSVVSSNKRKRFKKTLNSAFYFDIIFFVASRARQYTTVQQRETEKEKTNNNTDKQEMHDHDHDTDLMVTDLQFLEMKESYRQDSKRQNIASSQPSASTRAAGYILTLRRHFSYQ
jgi:hypothetical protein